MGRMRTTAVSQWLRNKGEEKAANTVDKLFTTPHTETEQIETVLYLTFGTKKSKKLFREMECDVTTHIRFNFI
jgi:hypothetical protein